MPVTVELCQSAKTSWEKNKKGPRGSGTGRRVSTHAPLGHFGGTSVAPASVGAITECQVESEGNNSEDGNDKGSQVVAMTWLLAVAL